MSCPYTTLTPQVRLEGLNVVISWSLVNINIIDYEVLMGPNQFNMLENIHLCDGSSSTVIATRRCSFPLKIVPYQSNIGVNQKILAKIRSRNQYCYSRFSEVS